ncbi:MAG: TIGR02186 family protein [Terriglobales bacterium]
MRHARLAAAALVIFASLPRPAPGQPGGATGVIIVVPERVEINLFYNGANIEVAAEIPAGYEAAARLMAHPERLELKKLGKKAGVLWMGAGSATFENIPAVYQVLTSAPLAGLGPQALRAQWMLGYDSLIPDHAPEAALRGELVGLKERDGLFALREGALARAGQSVPPADPLVTSQAGDPAPAAPIAQSPQLWRGTFRLPASAPPGDYSVDLIGFRDQHAVHLASATLHIEHAGAVRFVRHLAIDHGLTYGSAASLFAIVVGLLTGRLFRSRSHEGH